MTGSPGRSLLPVLVLLACAYVLVTSVFLPPVVASHFDAAGGANDYMSRAGYMAFMAGMIVGLPFLVVYLPNRMLRSASRSINLPNRDYWLAPERRGETVDYVGRQNEVLGMLIIGFLCYVHGLVLQANAVTPPRLSTAWLIIGMVLFVAAIVIWSVRFIGRFRRVPQTAR